MERERNDLAQNPTPCRGFRFEHFTGRGRPKAQAQPQTECREKHHKMVKFQQDVVGQCVHGMEIQLRMLPGDTRHSANNIALGGAGTLTCTLLSTPRVAPTQN